MKRHLLLLLATLAIMTNAAESIDQSAVSADSVFGTGLSMSDTSDGMSTLGTSPSNIVTSSPWFQSRVLAEGEDCSLYNVDNPVPIFPSRCVSDSTVTSNRLLLRSPLSYAYGQTQMALIDKNLKVVLTPTDILFYDLGAGTIKYSLNLSAQVLSIPFQLQYGIPENIVISENKLYLYYTINQIQTVNQESKKLDDSTVVFIVSLEQPEPKLLTTKFMGVMQFAAARGNYLFSFSEYVNSSNFYNSSMVNISDNNQILQADNSYELPSKALYITQQDNFWVWIGYDLAGKQWLTGMYCDFNVKSCSFLPKKEIKGEVMGDTDIVSKAQQELLFEGKTVSVFSHQNGIEFLQSYEVSADGFSLLNVQSL